MASGQSKPGQESGGAAYYLESLTWGLGWAAALAALAGAALELRRDLVRGLILVALPVALFAYLSFQARYFGRWFLPAYPALAMLAAAALVRAWRRCRRGAGALPLRGLALAALCAVVLVQPVAADVRSALVLGREDTRVNPMTGPTPLATPISGSTNGKKMYISTHRPALIRIDFWNAEWASSAVAVRPSGRRNSLRMNRSAELVDGATRGSAGRVWSGGTISVLIAGQDGTWPRQQAQLHPVDRPRRRRRPPSVRPRTRIPR